MEKRPISPLAFIPLAVFMAVIGWAGLYALVEFTRPTDWRPLWLFFFLGFLAVTGTALPAVAFLNRRFPTTPPASADVILREAIWFGVYFTILAWLQIGRVLNAMLIALLAIGLVIIESMLRLREISRWKP
ncbi:MAG: hypothetical protein ACOYYS_22760 [Chloroflexota bacterium]